MTTRILVATTQTQNDFPGDFAHAAEGEVVTLAEMCDGHRLDEGVNRCGCDRAFSSAATGKCTTSVLIVESDQSRDEIVRMFADRYSSLPADIALEASASAAGIMLDVAAHFPAGSVLGANAEGVYVRRSA